MKKIILILLVCVAFSSYAQKQTINNGDSGSSVRTKLNSNFTQLYAEKADSSAVNLRSKNVDPIATGLIYSKIKMDSLLLNGAIRILPDTVGAGNAFILSTNNKLYFKTPTAWVASDNSGTIVRHNPIWSKIVSIWDMEDTGASITDAKAGSSGVAANGVLVNQTGKIGKCITFDGTDDDVLFSPPPSNLVTIGASRSISAWVNIATDIGTNSDYGIVSKGASWSLNYNHSLGYFDFTSQFTPVVTRKYYNTHATWVFVVVTYNSATNTRKVYINGSSDPVIDSTSGSITDTYDYNLHFGRNGSSYFKGSIDQVVIYNTEITTTDIDFMFNSGNGRAGSTL